MKDISLYNMFCVWTIPKIVILAIFTRFKFYNIINIPGLETYSVWLMTLFLCFYYRNLVSNYFRKYPSYYFVGVIILLIAQIIYTYITYGQNILDTFQVGMHWIFIMLYPFIIYIFEKDGGIHKLMKVICFLTFISAIVLILTAILFNHFGIVLVSVDSLMTRANRLRLYVKDLFTLMILYSLFIFYCKQKICKRYIFLIYFIFGIFTIFYVAQTRILSLSVIISICAILFMASKGILKKNIFILCFMTVISLAYSSGIISRFLSSFDEYSDDSGSTLARLGAIDYYYETFFVEHPIMGMGWLTTNNPESAKLKHGNSNTYHIVDIGFLGLLFELGLSGTFFYVSILLRFAYVLFRNRNKKIEEYPLLFGIFVYLIITSGSLIITDIFRMFMFPFCIAIFEYIHNRERGKLCIA